MADILPVAELAEKQFEKKKKEYFDNGKTLSEMEEAALYAQCLALNTLKAPATAKFPDLDEMHVVQSASGYTVAGFVDSQNSFGAYIRTQYSYNVQKVGDKWGTSEVFVDADQAAEEKAKNDINNTVTSNTILWWFLGILGTVITFAITACEMDLFY